MEIILLNLAITRNVLNLENKKIGLLLSSIISDMEEIIRHFHDLTAKQESQFASLSKCYAEWNEKINVISRKDMDNFYIHHVLHSLGIAKVMSFIPGAKVMDAGTGGGFPGIPLAIMFPETDFLLVDSIGKKIKVVNEVANSIGLTNVKAIQSRVEDVKGPFDFIVSRAVTNLPDFLVWIDNKISKTQNHSLENGVLYLKGGELSEELRPIKKKVKLYNLSDYFEEDFFETKKVVHVAM